VTNRPQELSAGGDCAHAGQGHRDACLLRIGRAVAFSLAAFRQAFAGGRDLGAQDTVLIAGAACEMHPSALLKGVALRSVAEALAQATARARSAGASVLPAIEAEGVVFDGATAVERAAELLGRGAVR